MFRPLRAFAVLVLSVALPASVAAVEEPMRLSVDASTAPGRVLHVQLAIPVHPGPLTLLYPKWIPGNHMPSGPIADLAGLRLSAGGRPVEWRRDPVDPYVFRCRVPAGASRLDVAFDRLQSPAGAFASGRSLTSQLAVLDWNELLLYPAGRPLASLMVAARLRLPPGWSCATALAVADSGGGTVGFAPVPLTTLVDSPVQAGTHRRRVEVGSAAGPPVAVSVAADGESDLELPPGQVARWRRLVAETTTLLGPPHYRRYEFLLSLSDDLDHYGLEHLESSDDRAPARSLTDETWRDVGADLLPHEYVHSWNGKYRRPAGLLRRDFQDPERTDLLWIYEGLTEYLGWVLTARSGLATPPRMLEELGYEAAGLERAPGRAWRSLEDTEVSAPFTSGGPTTWLSRRRGADYYDEGMLIWLEADVLIRRRSGGRRSLDDFCRAFFGGAGAVGTVAPYEMADVVKALDRVLPHDWSGFFAARCSAVTPHAPLGGIVEGGWRLAWAEGSTDYERALEATDGGTDLRLSLGLALDEDDVVTDVVPGSAAGDAGLAPGMRPLAVNGRRFDIERLRDELRAGRDGSAPLDLIVEDGELVRTFRLDWHGGEPHPVLVRDTARSDLLTEILAPRTPVVDEATGP
jgi:predicted metalloprotease with PDZ domain